MSTQQADAEFDETLDYGDQVEQEPVANIDPTATHYQSVPQSWQPTIIQPSTAIQEPVIQPPYTPSGYPSCPIQAHGCKSGWTHYGAQHLVTTTFGQWPNWWLEKQSQLMSLKWL